MIYDLVGISSACILYLAAGSRGEPGCRLKFGPAAQRERCQHACHRHGQAHCPLHVKLAPPPTRNERQVYIRFLIPP